MAEEHATPKLHIDSDWKAEAQREKERLAQKEKKKADPAPDGQAAAPFGAASKSRSGHEAHEAGAGGPEQGQLPEPNFNSLVSMLASQAIMALGGMVDRESGRMMLDLEGARFTIDLIDMLEQKTKGNLSPEEAKQLKMLLPELRNQYVHIVDLVNKQMAAQRGPGVVVAPAGATEAIKPPTGESRLR